MTTSKVSCATLKTSISAIDEGGNEATDIRGEYEEKIVAKTEVAETVTREETLQ